MKKQTKKTKQKKPFWKKLKYWHIFGFVFGVIGATHFLYLVSSMIKYGLIISNVEEIIKPIPVLIITDIVLPVLFGIIVGLLLDNLSAREKKIKANNAVKYIVFFLTILIGLILLYYIRFIILIAIYGSY